MPLINVKIIEELKSGDRAIGGKSLTTADVKALAATRIAKAG